MMIRTTLLACSLAVCGACSNQVTYEDPEGIEVLGTGFSYTDLQAIAGEMTESFTQTNAWGPDKPRIVFGGVDNRTNQHIDTKNITDTVQTALIQSQKFTVVAGEDGISELDEELAYQATGVVDSAAAAELGRQLGAEYVFYGRFTSITDSADDVRSVFYKFTLNAVNVQTRQIVWADEKQLRKRSEKTFLGW
jgi:uncharacterized protein (TIGR02722 family)